MSLRERVQKELKERRDRLLNGEKLEYNEDYKNNVTYSRFDDSVEII